MKKLTICALVLIMCCSVACSKKKEILPGTTVVTVWAHQGQESEVEAIKNIIKDFNKEHHDIYADLTIIPSGFKHSYEIKVTAAKLSGKLPDILDLDGPFVAQYAWSEILQPLDDLVSKAMRNDFLPSIIEQGTYKGKLFALGAFESGMAVFYNKKFLDEIGVIPPAKIEDAWSWEEFVAVLERVKETGVTPLSLNMEWGPGEWYTYAFTPLVWSAGQKSIISPDGTATEGFLNSSTAVSAMKAFQDLFTKHLSMPTPPPDMFEQGTAAFTWSLHGLMDKYNRAAELEWGLMPLPYIKDRVAPSGSWCWGITTQSKNREAAFEVLSWIVGSETGIVPMVMANNAPPARKSALQLLPQYQRYPRRVFIDQLMKYAHPRPITPSYGVLSEKFSDAVHNIALGEDPKEQLDKAAKAIDVILKQQVTIKK